MNSIAGDAELAQFHRKQLNLLQSAEDSLSEFLKLNAISEVMFHPEVERVVTSKAQSAIELVKNLQNWVKLGLRMRRTPQGGRPIQEWKRQFVIRLAAFRHIITGEQLSTSPDSAFAGLVSAAWNSLHPKIPEIEWDSFVRRFARSQSLEEALSSVSLANVYARTIWRRPELLSKPTCS